MENDLISQMEQIRQTLDSFSVLLKSLPAEGGGETWRMLGVLVAACTTVLAPVLITMKKLSRKVDRLTGEDQPDGKGSIQRIAEEAVEEGLRNHAKYCPACNAPDPIGEDDLAKEPI